MTRAMCRWCGESIRREKNPEGPELWRSIDDGAWGCLQAAWNIMPRGFDEPDVPYPPHQPGGDLLRGSPHQSPDSTDHLNPEGLERAISLIADAHNNTEITSHEDAEHYARRILHAYGVATLETYVRILISMLPSQSQ